MEKIKTDKNRVNITKMTPQDTIQITTILHPDAVKSAVEWLKKEDKNVLILRMEKKITHAQVITRLLMNKRKAFEAEY